MTRPCWRVDKKPAHTRSLAHAAGTELLALAKEGRRSEVGGVPGVHRGGKEGSGYCPRTEFGRGADIRFRHSLPQDSYHLVALLVLVPPW